MKQRVTEALSLALAISTVLCVGLGLIACQSDRSMFQAPAKMDDELVSEQRQAIAAADSALQAQNWSAAEEQFAQFTRRYPVSVFSAQAFFGRARALEGLGQYEAANKIYRNVGEQARTSSPSSAAMAYVRMSYCYEALGDETRLTAALMDAEGLGAALPADVRNIEIPTRKAASLVRKGQNDEARKILLQVEKNLPDVSLESPSELRERHAKLLLAIGSQDLQAVNVDNFLPTMDSLQALQPFLWRAGILKAQPWSQTAIEKLSGSYTTMANMAFNPPKPEAGRSELSSERFRTELQKRWVARLLEAIESLKSFSAGDLSEGGEAFVQLIKQIENNGQQILWGRQSLTPLTDESKVQHRQRKQGRVKTTETTDAVETTKDKAKDANVADPNLKEGNP